MTTGAMAVAQRMLRVAAGSLVGGTLAMASLVVTDADVTRPVLLLVLVFAVVAFCTLAAGTVSAAPRRPEALAPAHLPTPPARPAEPTGPKWYQPAAAGSSRPAPAAPTAVATSPTVPVTYPPVPAARVLPVTPRSAADGPTQIVQCPRCAGFALDVQAKSGDFAFGCQRCRHQWISSAGTPWPPVVVRPRLWAPSPRPTA